MKRLTKSVSNKMISGVCGGIGEYFGIDPTLVRLGWAVFSLFTAGTGIVAYIVCAIVMPSPLVPRDDFSSPNDNEPKDWPQQ